MQYAFIPFYPLTYLCGLANSIHQVAISMLTCTRDGYERFAINPRDIIRLAKKF